MNYKLSRSLLSLIMMLALFSPAASAQRVGVVLSGGGATALSHVGFLRALEENHIPIDCIGGTSMGAVIAAMYASGYSAAEIDSITRSDEFYRMSTGELDDQLKFYFKSEEPNAGMARIRYGEGKFISNALPANLIDPTLLDWKFMEGFSAADMASKDNFDSLFVPFRCLASDVEHKSQIIFRNGPLNIAVRASCTYPFYLPPLKIGGTLLYDGGIFNNFPADIMYMEFMPDVIIGCNVSGEISSPSEDDLFSQLQTMILFRDTPQQLCTEMVVIKPKLDDVGTFDWDESAKAIDTGYKATLDSIAVIKSLVSREVSAEELRRKRWAFKRRQQPLIVEDIKIEGLSKSQRNYVRNMIGRNDGAVPVGTLKKPYFRVFEDDKVKSIFPTLRYNPVTGKYIMHLDVRKEKNLFLTVGGLFSSRSINTGYLGLKYNLFGSSSFSLEGNSYFGRFYGSGYASMRWDVAGKFPLSVTGIFCQNRWDYYRSLSTFFEDVKPSFVLLNERFGGLSFTAPAGNKGMIRAESMYTYQFDEYYQTQNFLSKDTADRTNFEGMVSRIYYERNTLNRRQYASSGTFLRLSFKHVLARETSIPGSTSALRDTTRSDHQWITAKLTYQNYFFRKRSFHLGVLLEGVASTQDFFSNYLASAIAAPAFQPIPESRTLFLPQFRAHNYASGGLQAVLALGKNLDLRAETYVFSAFGRILDNSADQAEYSFSIVPVYIASTSAVYHSPFGPVSLTANYYDLKEKPWSIVFNFGYILFNRSPRD